MNKLLDNMLSMVTEENMHSEITAGIPVGKEVLPPYSKNDNKLEGINQDLYNDRYSSVENTVEWIKAKRDL